MFFVLLRAGFFMVFLPWMSWLLARVFIPAWSVPAPGFGTVGIESVIALVVFLFGALIWMQNPSGRGGSGGSGGDAHPSRDWGGDWGDSGSGGDGGGE